MVRGKPVRTGCLVTLSNRTRTGFSSYFIRINFREILLKVVPFMPGMTNSLNKNSQALFFSICKISVVR